MGIYTFPVMLVGGIGLLAGVILAAASKFFAVEVDERVTKIRECLPGANCGGCGFAGCDDYAANLIATGSSHQPLPRSAVQRLPRRSVRSWVYPLKLLLPSMR